MVSGDRFPWPALFELPVVKKTAQILARRWHLGLAHGAGREHGHESAPIVLGGEVAGALLARPLTAPAQGAHPSPVALDERERAFVRVLLEAAAEDIALFLESGASTPRPRATAAPEPRDDYHGIIGRSANMKALYGVLDRVMRSDVTVLIQGENGTGKELVARAIHYGSARARRPFVVINCSAFNDNLLDSELFGHRRGAFTGAFADKPGLFETVDKGTFFLDEVGDMSPLLQVKLLRVLQEGTFIPVGDTETRRVDVRIIAATNRDLKTMVAEGSFREDLYYRINVINLLIPPLRERPDDIQLLIEHFLEKHIARNQRAKKTLSGECLYHLMQHSWPGNVRELENEIERMIVLAGDAGEIDADLLSPRIRGAAAIPEPIAPEPSEAHSLPSALRALERRMIIDALKRHDWNKTRAAVDLEISRRNLIRLVQKYQLESDAGRP